MDVVVVGAGLAGSEAAWQLAQRGLSVRLYEMKPARFSPAHESPEFAELVCSNSFRASGTSNAVGLLKEEMRRLGSLVMRTADETAVPAGRALAVDRLRFSKRITQQVETHPGIEVCREEVTSLPEAPLSLLATGPLTSGSLADELQALVGGESLYFYDAISPIVYADSIDAEVAFRASRWEDGEGDYLNLPLSEEAYRAFVGALEGAETVPLHRFEAALYFEGCLPIEEMARRGADTLAYGPMKPVGLVDPRAGRRPFAVVQLRHEDESGTLYNMVGFQTRLRIGEQKRVFRSLPAMAEAVFSRFGSVHRNTYLNAPRQLGPNLELRKRPGLFVTGQMAGVEGYVESAALGLLAGVFAAHAALGEPAPEPDPRTAHGALLGHLRNESRDFQPTNVNFGLFPRPEGTGRLKKREKHERLAERALDALDPFREAIDPLDGAAPAAGGGVA
ncbi:MAG: methylenetetrahydrofolate--tRNA-(uracil(54)-C(5))-methyltransferase (FADH(2)-oxidizing) TrmFO [bacterium]|nr:methylenetetrahydrofolate--tRNA-(uracil(54)-C(5))-methyltransferase (FADH(2)-oxidizing) TrmFO [bacterium]